MRKLSLLSLLLLALAQVAWGQVAAPRLSVGPDSFKNPAVLPFAHSIVGLGYLSGVTVEFQPTVGTPQERATGTGNTFQATVSNGSFGAGLDVVNLTLDIDPSFGGGQVTIESLTAGLGFMLGDSFSLGLASETESQDIVGQVEDKAMPYGGIVWKLGDSFFVGGTYGTRTVELSDSANPGPAVSGEQTVSRIGAGLYSRDNESGFHAEVYRELGELLEIRDPSNLLAYAEENEAIGLVLEARFSNILIGVERVTDTIDELQPGNVPPLATKEEVDTAIFLGWAPQEGLGLTLGAISTEETDEVGDVVVISATYVNLNFSF